MRVLMINSVCGIRSTGRICTDIAELLRQRGHECKIAYGRETVPMAYRDIALRVGSERGVRVHGALSRLFDTAGFHSKAATRRLLRKIEAYNPDVIHLHNLHGYYIHIGELFRYLKKTKRRVVWTLHDCWAFTGHCAHFDYVGCEKWKSGCYGCSQKKIYPASLLVDGSRRNYAKKKQLFTGLENMTIVTPSDWLAALVRQSFLKEYPVHTVYNGIDLQAFQPTESDVRARYGFGDAHIILGVASAWEGRKGLSDLCVLAERLGAAYRVVVVGVTEAQRKALPPCVTGISRTNSRAELAALYTVADVFVNPTKEEVFGLVNIEALACGTPVVTYRTGGSPEAIDESCGSLVEKNDIDGMQREIERICTEKPYSVEACLRRAAQFDKATRFAELIDEVYHL